MGSFVGSGATEKIIPLSATVLGTMAGSAADCVAWLRLLSAQSKLVELETGAPLTASHAARTLGALLRDRRGERHGVGTMLFDAESLFYVDGDGYALEGDAFAVGSGSPYAYPALEAGRGDASSTSEAAAVARRAVETAAIRDAFSGNFVNTCVAEKGAPGWRRLSRGRSGVGLRLGGAKR